MVGYYLNGGSCVVCSLPCINCSDSLTCFSCISGYFISGISCSGKLDFEKIKFALLDALSAKMLWFARIAWMDIIYLRVNAKVN